MGVIGGDKEVKKQLDSVIAPRYSKFEAPTHSGESERGFQSGGGQGEGRKRQERLGLGVRRKTLRKPSTSGEERTKRERERETLLDGESTVHPTTKNPIRQPTISNTTVTKLPLTSTLVLKLLHKGVTRGTGPSLQAKRQANDGSQGLRLHSHCFKFFVVRTVPSVLPCHPFHLYPSPRPSL